MKKIIFVIIFLIVASVYVYFNYNEIVNYMGELKGELEPDIILEESNEYKRSYKYTSFNVSDDYEPNIKEDLYNIFFNILNNGWNSFTFYCPKEYENCIKDVQSFVVDDTTLSNINGYVSPFNGFYEINSIVSTTGKVFVSIEKNYTETEINKINIEVDKVIQELELNNLSPEKAITKIHDYIIENTTYDTIRKENNESIYASSKANGVLFENHGVCSGYSDVFAIFMDKLDIPNLKIATDNHVWNLVYINEEWKHVDATWDDDDKNNKTYNSFLLIDTEKLLSLDETEHNFNQSFFKEASLNN